MSESSSAPRRGPKPNPNRGEPSGFRITPRARFEMQLAAPFVGTHNLQQTIDIAVDEFLSTMRQTPGYVEALVAAEVNQRARRGVVTLAPPDADR